jgi:ubiquinone/menaquinone biosynthesis C-methylase UbiE
MLDIGCGNGWFIFHMKNKGWEVHGVEPGLKAVETGRQMGLDINRNLLSTKFDADSFDYIRLNHSFEHIVNPDEILQEINRILKPSGKLFIGVPNINSLNAKIFREYWYYLGAPQHVYNYSDKTLPLLLQKYGFKIEKIFYNSWFIGMLGSFQIFLNRKSGKTSEQGFSINFKPFQSMAGMISKLTNLFHAGDCIEIIAEKEL